MKRFLLLVLTLLTISASAFAEKYTIQMAPHDGVEDYVFFGPKYTGSKTMITWAEYYVDLKKQTQIHFNNPYLVNPRDGAQDQIIFIKANGKYYVGHYSIMSDNHYAHVMAAFEFNDYNKAREVLFLWSYLKLLQSRDCTELHFIPNDPDFWWSEEDYFSLELPKDMIDDNYRIYKSNGYSEAFIDEQLLMDGVWHDLSNGQKYERGNKIYTCHNGKLYCNGERAYLEHDINEMIHVSVYHNSDKFYQLLTSGKNDYYYCQRCANNPYGCGLEPIEMYGYHYQDIISTEFWKEKVGWLRPVIWAKDDSIECTKD